MFQTQVDTHQHHRRQGCPRNHLRLGRTIAFHRKGKHHQIGFLVVLKFRSVCRCKFQNIRRRLGQQIRQCNRRLVPGFLRVCLGTGHQRL